MIIGNAKDVPLTGNPGTLPNMSETIAGWFQPLTFTRITKTVVNHKVVETPDSVQFMGVRQPMSPRKLEMKPEGQRSWSWETIHAWPSLQLTTDDVIFFDGKPYRVMQKSDWKEYGYVSYDIVQGYAKDGSR